MGRVVKIILVLFLVFLFFYTRLSHLDRRFSYGWDQEHLSYEVKKIIKDHKLTLIGPRVNNDRGFFLGPYFTYLLVPFYLTTNLHPSALMWVVILYNFAFFFITLYLIKKLWNDSFAYAFLFLWAINPILITYDINPWWPLLIPPGIMFYWFFLHRLSKKVTVAGLFGLGLLLGFLLNLHFQILFLILFAFLFFLIHPPLRKKVTIHTIFIMALGIALTMLPLLLFDLRHDFLNTKLLLNYFGSGDVGDKNSSPFFWIPVFTNMVYPFTHMKSIIAGVVFYGTVELVIYWLCTKKTGFFRSFYQAFFLIWLTFPFIFALYGKRPSEYYFLFLYPFIFMAFIDFFITIKKRQLLILFIALFFFANVYEIRQVMTASLSNFYYKEQTILRLKEITSKLHKKYNLSFDMPLGRDVGYRYLIDYYGVTPSGNPADPLIEIRIPPKEDDIRIGEQGIKIPKELKD